MDVGKKRIYPSAAQKSRLIALVEADEELRRGKFSSSFTKKEGEKRWENIALEVNSIPGSKREWKEWRKTWQDMKAAAKKKSAACRFAATSTGGGPPAPPLSEDNIAILRSISSSAVFGHTDCYESEVKFEDLPKHGNAATSQVRVVVLSDSEDNSNPAGAVATGMVMALHKDLPSTSSKPSLFDETLTGQDLPSTSTMLDEIRTGQENRTKGAKVTKRRVAVRRLDQSLAASQSMKKLMEEKLALKKTFYESVIAEMKAQTAILKTICEKI